MPALSKHHRGASLLIASSIWYSQSLVPPQEATLMCLWWMSGSSICYYQTPGKGFMPKSNRQ